VKRIVFLLAILCFASTAFAAAEMKVFKDVPQNHWAYDAIQRCVDAGILQGYDGQFHGKKLLNRYQVAVIVDKMLKKIGGGAMIAGDKKGVSKNIEALTIEFADELALLNVKVSTLEDSFNALKSDVEKLKGTGPAEKAQMGGGGLGLTGFASFGIVSTENRYSDVDHDGRFVAGTDVKSPWTGYANNASSTFFTDPWVAIGVNSDLGQGVKFNLRLFNETDVGSADNQTGVDQAYFKVDELIGKHVGGNVGGFSFEKLSMETNGAFGTPNYTVSESFLNRSWRQYHAYGADFMNKPEKGSKEFFVNLALLSGTDPVPSIMRGANANNFSLAAGPATSTSLFDHPLLDNVHETGDLSMTQEKDDNFGWLLFVGDPRGHSHFGWNLAYFDNGASATETDPTKRAEEAQMWQVGLDFGWNDWNFLAQYMDGKDTERHMSTIPWDSGDAKDWFFLVNYKIDKRRNVTARYESLRYTPVGEDTIGGIYGGYKDTHSEGVDTITLAYNQTITDNSMVQVEWLMPKDSFDSDDYVKPPDIEDNLFTVKYKVWF